MDDSKAASIFHPPSCIPNRTFAMIADAPTMQVALPPRRFEFRPEQPRTTLDAPTTLDGAPVLPGFTLKLAPFWNPDL